MGTTEHELMIVPLYQSRRFADLIDREELERACLKCGYGVFQKMKVQYKVPHDNEAIILSVPKSKPSIFITDMDIWKPINMFGSEYMVSGEKIFRKNSVFNW